MRHILSQSTIKTEKIMCRLASSHQQSWSYANLWLDLIYFPTIEDRLKEENQLKVYHTAQEPWLKLSDVSEGEARRRGSESQTICVIKISLE